MCHVPAVVNDLWSQIYAPLRTRQYTMLLIRALKNNCKFLPRWFSYGLSWSSYDLCPIMIPAKSARDFHLVRKRPSYFRIFPTNFRRLPNAPKIKCPPDVQEDVWAPPEVGGVLHWEATDLFKFFCHLFFCLLLHRLAVNIYFLVLFFCLLLHHLAVRISLPFYIFLQV